MKFVLSIVLLALLAIFAAAEVSDVNANVICCTAVSAARTAKNVACGDSDCRTGCAPTWATYIFSLKNCLGDCSGLNINDAYITSERNACLAQNCTAGYCSSASTVGFSVLAIIAAIATLL